jgi:riboflavin transporter FmnP
MASFGGVGNLAMNAVFVIAGAVGSKLLTQLVLGANNTGMVGYAGNAVAGGVMWFLAEKVLKNREAAKGVIAGTAVQIVLRLINDYTPFGSYVANLGMGDYQAQSFVTPQVLVDPFNSAEIQIPAAYRALAAVPAAAGMGSYTDYGAGSDY